MVFLRSIVAAVLCVILFILLLDGRGITVDCSTTLKQYAAWICIGGFLSLSVVFLYRERPGKPRRWITTGLVAMTAALVAGSRLRLLPVSDTAAVTLACALAALAYLAPIIPVPAFPEFGGRRFRLKHALIPFFVGMLFLPGLLGGYLVGKRFLAMTGKTHSFMTWCVDFPNWIADMAAAKDGHGGLGGFAHRLNMRDEIKTYYDYTRYNYMLFRLGTSVKPMLTVVGRKGWLFYHPNYRLLKESKDVFSPPYFDEFAQAMKARKDYFDQQGIKLFVFAPPSKEFIYPEYLPFRGESYLHAEEVYKRQMHILKTLGIGTIDLVDLYKAEKQDHVLYYSMDHHWTDTAAFLAFSEFTRWANQTDGLPFIDYKDYTYKQTVEYTHRCGHTNWTSSIWGGIAVCQSDLLGISRYPIAFDFERPVIENTGFYRPFEDRTLKGKLSFASSPEQLHRRYQNYRHTITKRAYTEKKAFVFGDSYRGAINLFLPSYFAETFSSRLTEDYRKFTESVLKSHEKPDYALYVLYYKSFCELGRPTHKSKLSTLEK